MDFQNAPSDLHMETTSLNHESIYVYYHILSEMMIFNLNDMLIN